MVKGRPSKYDPRLCDLALSYLSKGYSKQALAGKLGISRETLYEWCRTHEDFSDTIKKGEAKSLMFWEEKGMDGMMGKTKGFNSIVWIFTMKNRFGWSDQGYVEEKVVESSKDLESPDETLKRILKTHGYQLAVKYGLTSKTP